MPTACLFLSSYFRQVYPSWTQVQSRSRTSNPMCSCWHQHDWQMLPLTCHVPSNRQRQPLTLLSPMTFPYHIAWQCRNHPQAVPGPEFRTGTFSVSTSPLLVTTSPGPARAWQEEPQTCTLLRCCWNERLAFRRGTQSVKEEKNTAYFSPSLPPSSLSYLSRHRCSHSSFHGNSVYQGSPALLSSLIRFSHARSIFLHFFSPSIHFSMSSLVPFVILRLLPSPPSPHTYTLFLSLSASVSADQPTTPYWQIHEIDHFYTGGWIY